VSARAPEADRDHGPGLGDAALYLAADEFSSTTIVQLGSMFVIGDVLGAVDAPSLESLMRSTLARARLLLGLPAESDTDTAPLDWTTPSLKRRGDKICGRSPTT
jgi:hypothetical protein